MKKYMRGFSFYALLVLILLFALFLSNPGSQQTTQNYGQLELQDAVSRGEVTRIDIAKNAEVPTGIVTVHKNDTKEEFPISDTGELTKYALEYNIPVYETDIPQPNIFMSILPSIIILVAVVFLLIFIMNQSQGGGGGSRVMSFGKSRAKMVADGDTKVTFDNVAGLKEEKEELEEVVEFLKSPKKFVELGARIPKGVVWWDLLVPVKHYLQKPYLEKQVYHSLVFQVRTSLRCLLV